MLAVQRLRTHRLQQGAGDTLAAVDFVNAQAVQVKPVGPLAALADHEQPVAQRAAQRAELTHEGPQPR
ncbi:hypothetical protein D3C72_1786200 [compost metagenome]